MEPTFAAPGIDLADASDERLLVRREGDTTLVAIFDGAGSWGFGVEAARWARERMRLSWDDPATLRPSAIADDLLSLVDEVPHAWTGDFGWSFATMVVLVRPHVVQLVGAGSFGATVVRDGESFPIVAPRTLVDEVAASGNVPLEHLHEVPDVCLGPYLGDPAIRTASDLVSVETALRPGDRLLVAKANVLELLAMELVPWMERGAEAMRTRGIEDKRGTSPLLLVTARGS